MTDNAASLAGLSLLLVEDNRDIADLTALSLGVLGAEVVCAYNGKQALSQADTRAFDALVIDLGLPDMDGRVVAKTLRGRDYGARLIGLSGFDLDLDEEDQRLFDAYLQKPCGAPDIAQALAASGEET
ncbi:MAG: response regulator [Pseudomonadota bacterium]